ncbi:MAG: hypothetical protein DI537_32865 [Stutzerimonas stutzeri]|nr:MAG: hypothetical protein DI537_32865 [Stutzerimonas stutzeri]
MVFTPISTGWTGASHQFLLLNRDDGTKEIIRGGPERGGTGGDFLKELAGLRQPQAPSPYGALKVNTGPYQPGSPDYPEKETASGRVFDQAAFDGYFKHTVAEGPAASVEEKWRAVKEHALQIHDQKIQYSPTGPNSNALASESLRRAGIDVPRAEHGKMWGEQHNVIPWSPGAGDRLETREQIAQREIRESEALLDKRPVGNLLASLKLVQAEPVSLSPQSDLAPTRHRIAGLGLGD